MNLVKVTKSNGGERWFAGPEAATAYVSRYNEIMGGSATAEIEQPQLSQLGSDASG